MSDPTPDRHDDLLRDALRADADDVVAGPELLDRIRTSAAAPPRRRLAQWLLVAAAVIAVVGLGAVLLRDDDQAVDVANDPATTTSSTTAPEGLHGLPDLLGQLFTCDDSIVLVAYVSSSATGAEVAGISAALTVDGQPATTFGALAVRARLLDRHAGDPAATDVINSNAIPIAVLASTTDPAEVGRLRSGVSDLPGIEFVTSTDCREQEDETPERPTLVALVREDGWLVTVDLTTGDERELHFVGDPNASSEVEEGGPQFIYEVDLSPDGAWVYFSTCCEPADGVSFRIPAAGGEPEQVSFGAAPRVSPDGGYLATAGSAYLNVRRTDALGTGPPTASVAIGCCASRLAWSPDGTELALVLESSPPGEPEVLLFDWNGSSLTPRDTGKPDNPGSFVSWTPEGTLTVSSGEPIEDDRSLSQDRSYGWLLWVDEAGVVREQAGHESSDRTPIAGLPEALAADW